MSVPQLPTPSTQRLAVRLSADALRQVRAGHPWVFDSSVRSVNRPGNPGDLAVVFDDRREFAAIGLWDPDSPIAVRVLHRGRPTPVDQAFWRAKLATSVGRRAGLIADPGTTAYRLVHGENDGLPGLVVDLYDTVAVVKLYSAAWFPHLADVLAALDSAAVSSGISIDAVVLRLSRNVAHGGAHGLADGTTLAGATPEGPVMFLENGLRFEADVLTGQKTGHFLDQRDNRALVGARSTGRRVLDVFACTGGFSVNAAAGGAVEVVSVDLSRRSLATAASNMEHNAGDAGVAGCRHEVLVGDAFEVMADLAARRESFDLVIVDPPSFAPRERDRERAIDAYRRLAALGLSLVEDGGEYVQSSCSSRVDADELRGAVLDGARDAGRDVVLTGETGHAPDHPIGFAHGAYLTTCYLSVGGRS